MTIARCVYCWDKIEQIIFLGKEKISEGWTAKQLNKQHIFQIDLKQIFSFYNVLTQVWAKI